MKTTERFENAIMKLYKAYHNNELNAMDCKACAVGNICDNSNSWSNKFGYLPLAGHQRIIDTVPNKIIKKSGYSVNELAVVETVFIQSTFGKSQFESSPLKQTKEMQFKGLCDVIEYLCELDNIPNPMDYSALFETENDKPKRDLSEVFI